MKRSHRLHIIAASALLLLAACNRDVAGGRRCAPGDSACQRGGAAGQAGGVAGQGDIENPDQNTDSGVSPQDHALTVHVEDADAMTIEVITLACEGDCAEVTAVARGGNPPYTFEWDDGSTRAARRVCLDASTTLNVRATDTAIVTEELGRQAQTASAEVTATVIGCTAGDGGVDADVPQALCEDGETAVSGVMGEVVYFAGGAPLPAGRYRILHIDGCMKFGEPVGWTIHNVGFGSWFAVGESTVVQYGVLPGVAGFGYPDFETCVRESRLYPPLDLDFAGGVLGVWLLDSPYTDNVAGEDGRNPAWCLTTL